MHKFLPSIPGPEFLVLYPIYILIGFIIFKIIVSNIQKRILSIIRGINEDEYYVLTRKKDIGDIFYYITYKLYAKGYLIKENSYFIAGNKSKIDLTAVERNVLEMYQEPMNPVKYIENLQNKRDLNKIGYVRSFYDDNKSSAKIEIEKIGASKLAKKTTMWMIIAVAVLFIPGILRVIGGIANGKPSSDLVILMFFAFLGVVSGLVGARNYSSKKVKLEMKVYLKNLKKAEFKKNSYEDLMRAYFLGKGSEAILGIAICADILHAAYKDISDPSIFSAIGNNSSGCTGCSGSSGGCGGCGN